MHVYICRGMHRTLQSSDPFLQFKFLSCNYVCKHKMEYIFTVNFRFIYADDDSLFLKSYVL